MSAMIKQASLTLETILSQNNPAVRSASGRELVTRAWLIADEYHAEQKRAAGEPYVQHSLAVSAILAEMGLDAPTLAAGLLHDVLEDTTYSRQQMEQDFGREVLGLVEGVTKLGQFDNLD